MKVIKIEKRRGRKKGFYLPKDNIKIAQIDYVYFECEMCGIKVKKEKRRVNERYPYCKKCLIIKKYGVKNVFQLDSVKQKIKETNLKKYSVSSYTQTDEYLEKVIKTNLKKYGVAFCTQADEYLEKTRQTSLKKYGVEHFSKSSIVKKRKEKTNLERYGTKNAFQNDVIKEKIKKTMLKKYGKEFAKQVPEIQERTRETLINKYGINFLNEINKIIKENFYNNLDKRVKGLLTPLFKEEEYEGVDKQYKWKCNKCGNEFYDHLDNGRMPRCKVCFPVSATSKAEKEIDSYIQSLEFTTICNSRKIIPPYEIDVFIPEKNIGLEYDGIYWHSQQKLENRKDSPRAYHLNKTMEAHKKGIRLIHVFEDEWRDKQVICKNRIRIFLGIYERRIGARETYIKEVDVKISKPFEQSFHIQGSVGSRIKLGAFCKKTNEMVGVMTFGLPRVSMGQKNYKRKEGNYELLRFVTLPDIATPGLASKFFSYFIKQYNPEYVYSYSDIRWNKIDNAVYEKIGMKKISASSPSYFYFNLKDECPVREYRFKYRKNVLNEKLERFNPEKTEYENCLDNEMDRVFDCGAIKYAWCKDT